ncbi:conserved hypothetical protein [Ricinus communis]|uniref:Uncharacterized protein n=1 Tax=Ricinus communis TaxID=3988 RepID=B9RSD7_RICCO|nr:conserved hypothetical protein [Ricinus communis]
MVEQLEKNMAPQGIYEALLTTRRAIGGSPTANMLRGSERKFVREGLGGQFPIEKERIYGDSVEVTSMVEP